MRRSALEPAPFDRYGDGGFKIADGGAGMTKAELVHVYPSHRLSAGDGAYVITQGAGELVGDRCDGMADPTGRTHRRSRFPALVPASEPALLIRGRLS